MLMPDDGRLLVSSLKGIIGDRNNRLVSSLKRNTRRDLRG
jgi:hypothetical protein